MKAAFWKECFFHFFCLFLSEVLFVWPQPKSHVAKRRSSRQFGYEGKEGTENSPRKQERSHRRPSLQQTSNELPAGRPRNPHCNWLFSLRFSDHVLFAMLLWLWYKKMLTSQPFQTFNSGLYQEREAVPRVSVIVNLLPTSSDLPQAPSYFIDIWEFHTCLQLQLHTFFKGRVLWLLRTLSGVASWALKQKRV